MSGQGPKRRAAMMLASEPHVVVRDGAPCGEFSLSAQILSGAKAAKLTCRNPPYRRGQRFIILFVHHVTLHALAS